MIPRQERSATLLSVRAQQWSATATVYTVHGIFHVCTLQPNRSLSISCKYERLQKPVYRLRITRLKTEKVLIGLGSVDPCGDKIPCCVFTDILQLFTRVALECLFIKAKFL